MSLAGRCMIRLAHSCVSSSIKSTQLLKQGIPACTTRYFTVTSCRQCEETKVREEKEVEEGKRGHRIKEVSYQESIKYLESEAFKLIYGNEPVWKYYKRNFKGHYYPKPRAYCSVGRKLTTSSPCPLCRDDYLVVNYRNIALLEQFVSKLTGDVLDPKMTGLCMKQYKHLKLAVAQAKDFGLLEKAFHFRKYDYPYYYDMVKERRNAEKMRQDSDVSVDSSEDDNTASNEPEIDEEHRHNSERKATPIVKHMTKQDIELDQIQHKYNQ